LAQIEVSGIDVPLNTQSINQSSLFTFSRTLCQTFKVNDYLAVQLASPGGVTLWSRDLASDQINDSWK